MDSSQNPENTQSAVAAPAPAPAPSPTPDRGRSTDVSAPRLCVDVIIDMGSGLFPLIQRKNAPLGWALPGGFVDVGESVEEAALREVQQEVGLDVELVRQFHVYSNPNRDARGHNVSVVFLARGWGTPKAASDAKGVELFHEMNLPPEICFDHRQILRDYFMGRY